MSWDKIPGKAIVKCKFEVIATLEVDIGDVYMMDREIVDVISYQGLFREVDPYLPLDERTFGLDKSTLERLGIKVISIEEYSDPRPTGSMRSVRDWEIEVDDDLPITQTVKKTGEEK